MAVQPGFTITSGGYVAEIARTGAGLRGLTRGGVPLTEPWALGTKPPLSAGLILAPWPNRTEDGIYTFDGEIHRLDVTEVERNNAMHGFVRRVDWDDVETAEDAVTLTVDVGTHPGWPFDLHLRIRYAVSDAGLEAELTAENHGSAALPFALGFHTFLRVGDVPVDDCTLELGAALVQPLTERQLPAGPPVTVEGTDYDFRRPRPWPAGNSTPRSPRRTTGTPCVHRTPRCSCGPTTRSAGSRRSSPIRSTGRGSPAAGRAANPRGRSRSSR
ncbi:aldose epimerase family protein [Tsukamurella soli]|uniref:aldose epimerase family protein n=1 Tax=Tsukamurella soli TaxID=644556 RepID=UPI00361147AF